MSNSDRLSHDPAPTCAEKVPLSELFWKAANEYLDPEGIDSPLALYSCLAVRDAAGIDWMDWVPAEHPAGKFLKSLGCPVGSMQAFSLRLFKTQRARQGARYAWLMFASMYAEELEAKGEL